MNQEQDFSPNITVTGPNMTSKLTELKIATSPKDFRLMNQAELRKLFSARSSGRIILQRLIRGIIWQAYENISSGREEPVEGNLRTFWYRFVKPVLSHFDDDDVLKSDPYDIMLRVFTEMVLEHKLFSYRDFDFTDENWQHRRVGLKYPHIILFAEKRGWIRLLTEQHKKWDVTTLALGGAPSALTTEYTLNSIVEACGKVPEVINLVGIVDWDPSGLIIANSFRDQLRELGAKKITLETIIHPKHYSEAELKIFKYGLPKRMKTKTAEWLKLTGGISGVAMGLEAESMPLSRVRKLIGEKLKILL